MDSTSLAYNFPLYYQSMYAGGGLDDFNPGISQVEGGTLPQDLTLAEYTVCHKLRETLRALVGSISTFLEQREDCGAEMDEELANYEDTDSIEDPNLFENLLKFMVEQAEQFIIQLGEGFSLTPAYVHNLKKAYLSSDTLKSSVLFNDMLDLEDPENQMYRTVTLTPKFIARMHTSLLGGIVEKLSANFRGSEFVIAFNFCMLQSNAQAYELVDKITSANTLATYLNENCPHNQEAVAELMETLNAKLLDSDLYNVDGTVNYERVWSQLESYQKDRIQQIRKIANVIIGASLTEIEAKINLNKLLMYDVCFPAIERGT